MTSKNIKLAFIFSNCFFLASCDSDAEKDFELICGDGHSIKHQEGLKSDEILKEYIIGDKKSDLEKLVQVKHEDNTISYDGYISYSGLLRVNKQLSENPSVKLIKVDSLGGVTSLGLCFGELIYKNKLDVEVKNRVYSSAANYIFVAGRNKYISKNALIGFHGGEASTQFYDLEKNKDVKSENSITESSNNATKEWESEFYKKLGLNIRLVTAGQETGFAKLNQVGWTYTLDAFEYLGVNGIKLSDGVWDINTKYSESKNLFVIDKNYLIKN